MYFGMFISLLLLPSIISMEDSICQVYKYCPAGWMGIPVWLHYVNGTVFRTDNYNFKINTCNSFYCDQFKPIFPDKPKIWTENWPGLTFGAPNPHRPAEDVAFSVARFFQKGGSVQNYYMVCLGYQSGDNLKELHKAIKLCEHVLLNSKPVNLSLGPSQEADVYADASGGCVTSQTALVEMVPDNLQQKDGSKALKWEVFVEKAGIWGEPDFMKNGFVDHINTTKDTTDYLWYTTSIVVGENEEFLKEGRHPVLLIESMGHALHAFVNQELQGSASGNGSHSPFKFKNPISLKAGKNEIALLSMTVGLQNAGSFYEWVGAGLTSVKIEGFNNGTVDLSHFNWIYKIGLQGEKLGIYKPEGVNSVSWVATSEPPKKQPLTWYKVVLDPPAGNEPVGLDMLHMGKGLAWLNGEEIGRYWPRKSSVHEKCVTECDYRGKFMPDKCFTGYHVPRSWFKPSGNLLVIFEEKGGDPEKITFSRRKMSSICALIAEDYPSADQKSLQEAGSKNSNSKASVHLGCPQNAVISAVKFASFGTPTGKCGSYSEGECHDPNSISVVENACLNKTECAIELTEENFNKGLCPDFTRRLAVEAKQNTFVSFPISIQNPNSIRLPICHATAKSQTGPVKKRSSSSSTTSPNTNKKKKRRSKGGSGDNLNLRDVEIVKDDGGLADVQVDDDDDDIDDSFYSDSVSRKVSTHPNMPLPKPPAGFVVDDSGRVLLASTKRIVTMVDPTNNYPLECVIRRIFRSSRGDECMLLCPADTPVQILKSVNIDGWSAVCFSALQL
ncbi:hypothetical protein NC652_019897 [Populus alba x Populus x berolinensis]|nr:hypothetical protein NC652_019897 [Populus alba x Populus x berolinensis]